MPIVNSINAQPIKNIDNSRQNVAFGAQKYIVIDDENAPKDSFVKKAAKSFVTGALIDTVISLALKRDLPKSALAKSAAMWGGIWVAMDVIIRLVNKVFDK